MHSIAMYDNGDDVTDLLLYFPTTMVYSTSR